MDAGALRDRQRTLKDGYRQDPGSALITLSADADLDVPGAACRVRTAQAAAEAGLHPAAGGDGTQLCSGDMLLEALVGCAGVTLRAVAESMGINVRRGHITAHGELDFRGTLGVDRNAPVGFRTIRLVFDIDADADDLQATRLRELTERYCVVYQTLHNATEVVIDMNTTAV